MVIGYAVLYNNGELVISKNPISLNLSIRIDFGKFDENNVPWKNDYSQKFIESVRIFDKISPNSMYKWFDNCYNLKQLIDFDNLDVLNCFDFSYLFNNCFHLTDISGLCTWNVSNGCYFHNMFSYCLELKDISILNNWNVLNGKNFSNMFDNCSKLKEVNLNNWNVLNGKRFHAIFSECSNLCIVNISKWNMSHVEYFDYMFLSCENLKEIWLPDTITLLSEKTFNLCNLNLKIHWRNKIYTYADLIEYQEF